VSELWLRDSTTMRTVAVVEKLEPRELAARHGRLRPIMLVSHPFAIIQSRPQGDHLRWRLMRFVPTTQILFGGDYPFVPISETAVGMTRLGLSASDRQAIGRYNAARLLPRFSA
jgi:hypothetical protein